MTSIIEVEGLTEEELNQRVVTLAQDHLFQEAADAIAEWIEWDWHGRWADIDEKVEDFMEPRPSSHRRPTIAERLTGEFGKDVFRGE